MCQCTLDLILFAEGSAFKDVWLYSVYTSYQQMAIDTLVKYGHHACTNFKASKCKGLPKFVVNFNIN
jgi:hypothetical protein